MRVACEELVCCNEDHGGSARASRGFNRSLSSSAGFSSPHKAVQTTRNISIRDDGSVGCLS